METWGFFKNSTEERGSGSADPRGVSSGDNGAASVATVRITEHNGGGAAVKPAQGKQQEAVVIDSAATRFSSRS